MFTKYNEVDYKKEGEIRNHKIEEQGRWGRGVGEYPGAAIPLTSTQIIYLINSWLWI